MNVSDACRDAGSAEAILARRIGFPVTLVERSAERGQMVWVVFCDGAEVCEIEEGADLDTVSLPKYLTLG